MRREDWKVGLFANLHCLHGFGPLFSETDTNLPGVQVDHFDVHSVPATAVNEQSIARWRKVLNGRSIQTVWAGFPGETYETIEHTHGYGLVPRGTRAERFQELRRVVDLAKSLEARAVGLHIGHLTGRGQDGNLELISQMRELANNCGLPDGIVLETGQEQSATLLDFLVDVGSSNLRINFDPANMILYGSGDPMEAFAKVAKWVRSVHLKDAKWTTGTKGVDWGTAADLGEGDVGGDDHFAAFLRAVAQQGRKIPCTIEFEMFDGTHGSREHWDAIDRQFDYVHETIEEL